MAKDWEYARKNICSKYEKQKAVTYAITFLTRLKRRSNTLPIHCNVNICNSIRVGLNVYSDVNSDIDILKAIPELKPKWYKLRTWWYGGYWFKTGTKVELSEEEFKKAIDIRIEHLRKTLEKI